MKKRLRKKKRVGEFRELGFAVVATLKTEADALPVLGRLVVAVERLGLAFGGGVSETALDGFVTLAKRGSATDDHRKAVEAFFAGESAVASHEVAPLVDAWH